MTYDKHVFICENIRDPKTDILGCCGAKGGSEIVTKLKKMVSNAGLKKIRINRSGCLGDCRAGVVIVIYPAGIWLKNVTVDDVEKIFEEYILS